MIEEGRNCHCFVKAQKRKSLFQVCRGPLQGEFLIIAVIYTVVVPKPAINICFYIINSPIFLFPGARIL